MTLAGVISLKGLIGSIIDPSIEEASDSQPGLVAEAEGDMTEEMLVLELKNAPTLLVKGAVAVGVACVKDEGESAGSVPLGAGAADVSTFHIRREPRGTSGAAGWEGGSIFHILNALHPEADFFGPVSLVAGAGEGSRSSSE